MTTLQRTNFLIAAASLISGSYGYDNITDQCTRQNPFYASANATGSLSMPGFQVNSSYPASNWTWSAYVGTQYDEASNVTSIATGFGLKTSPIQNLEDPNIPYTGCVSSFNLSPQAEANSIHDSGDCVATFGSACLAEILSAANSSAQANSGTSNYECGNVLSTISALGISLTSACNGLFYGGSSSGLTVNSSAPSVSPCNYTNPGNSNATNRAFFSWIESEKGKDNFTIYDRDLETPWVLLVSAWGSKGHGALLGQAGWADTRLLCIPRNQTISEGSRNTFVELGSGTSTSTASGTGASPSSTKPSAGVMGKRVNVGVLALVLVVGMGLMM
ncbi:uncharacterized protein PAC_02733 [Phialocephala subalpina]|uniref:Uncharacterized protein n=1 Tax=Phialocephala subalpina TaxID=576137 RepID=A0A1L7WJB7_9HELO|nr:uncharacterized protein PAC_02733 [Phialocephala subalpina]